MGFRQYLQNYFCTIQMSVQFQVRNDILWIDCNIFSCWTRKNEVDKSILTSICQFLYLYLYICSNIYFYTYLTYRDDRDTNLWRRRSLKYLNFDFISVFYGSAFTGLGFLFLLIILWSATLERNPFFRLYSIVWIWMRRYLNYYYYDDVDSF